MPAVRTQLAALLSSAACIAVVLVALRRRGLPFAIFASVLGGIHTLLSLALFNALFPPATGVPGALGFAALQSVAYLHYLSLLLGRPRPRLWRALISIPGSFFLAGTMLALPLVLLSALGVGLPAHRDLVLLPYGLAALGVLQSLWTRRREVDITLHRPGDHTDPLLVRPYPRGLATPPTAGRPLRIVQISDPHLGPFMSEQRLHRICAQAVAQEPDLVLLTGDFLTIETQGEAGPLSRALAPLAALPGRCFACRGNHDLEAPHIVAAALRSAGVRLLIDEEALVTTPAGPVQVLGVDFTFTDRARHLAAVCAAAPRRPGHLRLVLLHDPGAFRHLPAGEGDLVLSGHTHGGQLGLLSLGLAWTIVRGLSTIPDHGLWARGADRLYVHRGTGHYGFPLRVGVPAEEGLLRVHQPALPDTAT